MNYRRARPLDGGMVLSPVLCTFILCDKVSSRQGKFSLEGIFYRVHPQAYPARHKCYVVIGWCGGQGVYRLGLKFWSPGDRRLLLEIKDFLFTIKAASPYHNTVISAELSLPEEGIYYFEVLLDDRQVGRFPLYVMAPPAARPQ